MDSFTPLSALLGGSLIGLAASLLMLTNGRIAGVSGIFSGALEPRAEDRGFRLSFLAGLLLAGVLARAVHATTLPAIAPSLPALLVGGVAGLLVGFGTRLGSGCTSGHGVSGLSRLSKRSLVATLTFMATAMATVAVLHVIGGRS
jgi:uncharacterized membrane protein YedE/YeeE